ncbi:MAG: hypothetical protein U0175_36045 [Caldilineaceae bacterium]
MKYLSIRSIVVATTLMFALASITFAQDNTVFLPLITNNNPQEWVEDPAVELAPLALIQSTTTVVALTSGQKSSAKCSDGSRLRLLRISGSDGSLDMTQGILECYWPINIISATPAASANLVLAVGQTASVKCKDGSQLRILRTNGSNGFPEMTQGILECYWPSAATPTAPTATATKTPASAATPTRTPVPGVTATRTPVPPATNTPLPSQPTATPIVGSGALNQAIVFVSRAIPPNGSIYWNVPKSLPGVGPWARLQTGGAGKLLVREVNGTIRTLVDGNNPTAASLNLVDVNAPDVSYDGSKIIFAGLPKGTYDNKPMGNPSAWRVYLINADGSGLKQLTRSDLVLNYSQFKQGHTLNLYDDFDPAWMPDGRIVFSSTRWPSYAMYSAAHTSNLYVMNADGSAMHRITGERNGADRATIDPLTGRIVYSRWWRNFRAAANTFDTITSPEGGWFMKDGLVTANQVTDANGPGGQSNLKRNAWQLGTINPDGTDLRLFAGGSGIFLLGEDGNHAYGGSFASNGVFYANFFPMKNMSEAAGFGGIRRYTRGPNGYTSIIGVTSEVGYELASSSPASYGVYKHDYAAEPVVLPDGRLLISWAADINQDYGLYLLNPDGTNRQLVYDLPGMTELRAKVLAPRALPPIIPDKVTKVASVLPPTSNPPYDIDGTFTFKALNVYFNAPVDSDMVTAMPVGSAGTIRFFLDHQRNEQTGSKENLDWPILLSEMAVSPNGSVVNAAMPANLPLFEQIRSPKPQYLVPLTGRTEIRNGGAAHVAGLNYGRPGETVTCVGCHAGHSLLPVPANPADAQFTNLAPGAAISFSSTNQHPSLDKTGKGLIDRKVQKGRITDYWRSENGKDPNTQWVQLVFPVPVTVRTVRLYNPRPGDATGEASIQVNGANVKLYTDAAATQQVTVKSVGALAVSGTDVGFTDVKVRAIRIEFTNVTGTMGGERVASLAEVEVIARGEAN